MAGNAHSINRRIRSAPMKGMVPQMHAANAGQRVDLLVWELPRAAAPSCEVCLVWHASTAKDPAHQWIRAQVHRLFGRVPPSA